MRRLWMLWLLLLLVSPAGAEPTARSVALGDSIRRSLRSQDMEAARTFAREQLRLDREYDPVADAEAALRRATTLTYLSLAERNLEDFEAAEEHARAALRWTHDFIGAEHGTTASALNNLAGVLKERGELLEAATAYRSALALRRRIFGPEHPETIAALNNLGALLLDQGDWAGAEVSIRQALAGLYSSGRESTRSRALAEQNLVRALIPQGGRARLAACDSLLHRARTYFLSSSSEEILSLAAVAGQWGQLDMRRQRPLVAVDHLRRAIELRVRARGPRQAEVIAWRLRLAEALRAADAPTDSIESQLRQAMEVSAGILTADHPLSIESRTLLGSHLLRRDRLDEGRQLLERAASDYDRARERLGRRWRRATAPLRSPWTELAAARLLSEDESGAWTALQRAQARLTTELMGGAPITIAELAALLEDDEVLVGWLDASTETWAYTLRPEGTLHWQRLEIRAPGAVAAWRQRVEHFGRTALANPDDPELSGLARRIEEDWWSPVADSAGGSKRVIVIAHGRLQGMPLQALPFASRATAPALRYAPSATVLASLRKHPARDVAHVLAVGDPDFGGDRVAPLPSTRLEVEDLLRIYPKGEALLGSDASVAELLRSLAATPPPDLVHLATHAWIDPWRPEDSRLELARHGTEDAVLDLVQGASQAGRITAGEIAEHWKLDARLVTLSACSTALGRNEPGEGPLGFAQAFFRAGARGLLLSLWDVDDEGTAQLMHRFYLGLASGAPPSIALRDAERDLRELRRPDGHTPYAHPWFWSAFVLIGDD